MKLAINNKTFEVPHGTTVAAAIITSGSDAFRRSMTGEPRGPLCGMGICFECRVTINGVPHERSCTVTAADGMEVGTGE
ncbi:MAG: (2Fe-2S)-binding protein [Pyrinomonadaceae bacterium]